MQKIERVEPWPAPPDDSIEQMIANYKAGSLLALPGMGDMERAARIMARMGFTVEEATRALTPKKKPESIRELLDAPMKKWREE